MTKKILISPKTMKRFKQLLKINKTLKKENNELKMRLRNKVDKIKE